MIHQKYNSIKRFNRAVNLYKKLNEQGTYIFCYQNVVREFTCFEYNNLSSLMKSKTIDILWIPEKSIKNGTLV